MNWANGMGAPEIAAKLWRPSIPGAFGALTAICALDWILAIELYLSALYLTLILLVAWHYGPRLMLLVCTLSIANQTANSVFEGSPFLSPVYLAVDLLNWLIAYLVGGAMCSWAKSMYSHVLALSGTLEKQLRKLREQAADLEAANSELSTFSYTVAHDLRSPLRAIDGFGAMLLKDNAAVLDKASIDNIERMTAASGRMREMIDALLKLSRVTRQELVLRDIDFSALAENTCKSLADGAPARKVRITVQPGIRARADAALLDVVLQNLIGNAWKFTGNAEEPAIEIGLQGFDGQEFYFVRDNGAGFDMKYAAKLFAPFQRLHRADEYEGTGIGLATVQRIIRRHKGEIRIESAINHGTTVFFSLGTRL